MVPAGRVAAAPISWGVCEVAGWGHQLAPERVLEEMRELGFAAAEFGPPGFLPPDPAGRAATLRRYGLRAVGGFLAVVLHDAARDPMPLVLSELDAFVAAGADTLVLAAATGVDGYEQRAELTAAEWETLFGNVAAVTERAGERGVRVAVHPHVGTAIERPAEVGRLLDGSPATLCLDTGHLLVGGTDPVELARTAAGRVSHVHLKDVHASLAERVRDGRLGYLETVRQGLFAPLGEGDVDVTAIVDALDAVDYQGWYVLEQDLVLTGEPPPGTGPRDDVALSLRFLTGSAA
ncbi:MAG: TIM barrel protein [Streptosporangiales bacterium]|nr:TIM barrel protein [Streptosporangiales bacterium]